MFPIGVRLTGAGTVETFNKIKGIDLWFLVDFIPKLLEDYLNIYFDYYHNPYSNHTDLAKLIAKILI